MEGNGPGFYFTTISLTLYANETIFLFSINKKKWKYNSILILLSFIHSLSWVLCHLSERSDALTEQSLLSGLIARVFIYLFFSISGILPRSFFQVFQTRGGGLGAWSPERFFKKKQNTLMLISNDFCEQNVLISVVVGGYLLGRDSGRVRETDFNITTTKTICEI